MHPLDLTAIETGIAVKYPSTGDCDQFGINLTVYPGPDVGSQCVSISSGCDVDQATMVGPAVVHIDTSVGGTFFGVYDASSLVEINCFWMSEFVGQSAHVTAGHRYDSTKQVTRKFVPDDYSKMFIHFERLSTESPEVCLTVDADRYRTDRAVASLRMSISADGASRGSRVSTIPKESASMTLCLPLPASSDAPSIIRGELSGLARDTTSGSWGEEVLGRVELRGTLDKTLPADVLRQMVNGGDRQTHWVYQSAGLTRSDHTSIRM